jgi:hypothetical protein
VVLVAPARAQDDEKVDEAHAKKALRSAEKIEKEVEKLRDLKYQVPVRKGVESEVALKRHLIEETNKPENVAELAKNERVAKAFGLIPKDFDLAKEEAQLLADQIAGFYDNEGKKLRLVEKKAGFMGMDKAQLEQMDELTMAHELEHALQDQTFDLGRWFAITDGHADRTEAWKCTVEGEAVFVSMKWMFDKQMPGMDVPDLKMLFEMNKSMSDLMPQVKQEQEKLEKLPAWLVKNLTMPYEEGAIFVQQVYQKGGWDAVNKLFQDPPSSTQQVLHPKKYFDRVEPLELNMPSLQKVVGGKSKELDRSTWGEFNIRILLETLGTKSKTAKKVAAGWRGDQYQAVELEDGSLALVWLTLWEDADKARAFLEAYQPGFLKLNTGTRASLDMKDDEVLLVQAQDGKLVEKLRSKAWATAVQDGHLKPLPGMLAKPDSKDFTEADESSGFGGSSGTSKATTLALGDRVLDDQLGFAVRYPRGWEKLPKEPNKGIAEFSRGVYQGPNGAELRVFDFPLPFDKETLISQLEALAQKGGTQLPKKSERKDRIVGGHEAFEMAFSGLQPSKDATEKRDGKFIAVEREGVTLAFALTAPEGKLGDSAGALDAVVGSLEFVPAALKGEKELVDLILGDEPDYRNNIEIRFNLAPGFSSEGKAGDGPPLRWKKDGASIQFVRTRATTADLEAEARATESDRSRLFKGYRSLGTAFVDRLFLDRAFVSDYELETEGGKRRVREIVAIVAGWRVAFTCSCSPEAWDKNRTAFERALATFDVEAKKSENRPAEKPKPPAPKKDESNEPF